MTDIPLYEVLFYMCTGVVVWAIGKFLVAKVFRVVGALIDRYRYTEERVPEADHILNELNAEADEVWANIKAFEHVLRYLIRRLEKEEYYLMKTYLNTHMRERPAHDKEMP